MEKTEKKLSKSKTNKLLILGLIILSAISIIHIQQRLSPESELIFLEQETKNEIIKIDIEIADTEEERQQGLMNRESIPDTSGMLFIFEESKPRSFWMKNTSIPLDIIFVDENLQIVTIQSYTEPFSESSISSSAPAMYAVEVNAGFTDKFKIEKNDSINFTSLK